MNDIVKRSSTELATAFATSLVEGIDNSRAETPVIGGGKPLLRLLKSGVWVFGQTNDPVQEGSRWAVNPHTIEHGYTCWSDYPGNTKNELLGERMVPVTLRKPVRPEPVGGFEWKEQRVFQAKCILGDDEGVEVLYKTNSISGMRDFDNFLAAVRAQASKDPHHIVSIIELEVDFYNHSKYGQIFIPVINVRGWSGMDVEEVEEIAPKGNGKPSLKAAAAAPAAAAPSKPRKPSLKEAAAAQQPVDDVVEDDGTVPFDPAPLPTRPGAAPKRQRPSARA